MNTTRQESATSNTTSTPCPPPYKALVLSCIDPRMQKHVSNYLENERGLHKRYSQITLAGAAISAVAPEFESWHQTFWENLNISLKLHEIHRIIVINHRGCGAATEAYGFSGRSTNDEQKEDDGEQELHRAVLNNFREQVRQRHPQLIIETYLMDLDGTIKPLE